MTDHASNFREFVERSLGVALHDGITPGRIHRFPTSARRGDDAGYCKLSDDGQWGFCGCFRSGVQLTWTALDRTRMTPTQRAQMAQQMHEARQQRLARQRDEWRRNAANLDRRWKECEPITGLDPVSLYLSARLRCDVTPPACIGYHPALPYHHEGECIGTFPAMVARFESPEGQLLALHRTWLTPDGQKAPVPGAVKKLTGTTGSLEGGCIPLASPQSGLLGIAEGIETALAASCASGVPTVAAYSAGSLACWRWPTGLRRLLIFADADQAGAKAAERLAQRIQDSGRSVEILTPTQPGTDWCDVWAQRDTKEAT